MTEPLPTLDPGAIERLLEMTGGDPAFVRELVDTFFEDAETQLAAMAAAAGSGSAEAMVRPAHSLKSNAASVGGLRLSEHAKALEAEARGGSVAEGEARVAAARAELDALRAQLAEAVASL